MKYVYDILETEYKRIGKGYFSRLGLKYEYFKFNFVMFFMGIYVNLSAWWNNSEKEEDINLLI